MDSKVKVTADKAGNVIVKSSRNTDFGHIRVEQTRMVVEENGFARKKKLSALIPGTIEDLKAFGWTAGEQVEGKIVVKESLNPFNKRDPERDFKIAGKSGIICTIDESPIFRKHFFTLSSTSNDVLIAHDNEDEIKAAYAELADSVDINQTEEVNKDFEL
jgi:hypothetical protein